MSVSAAVTVVYGSENYTLDCYLDQPAALFRCQLWSASGLHPEEQHVTGLVTGVLSDESSLLSVTPGTWVLLQKRAPPTPTPAPVPPAPTHPSMMGGRGLEEMAARISSGFETARLHHDPDQLAAAREVIPWDSKILPRARELEAEYCARIEAAEHERDQKCAEGRSLPAAAAGAAIDRVRFVPIETREFTCPLLQLARLRLFDTSGVELLLVEAECQAGRSPEGEEPLKAIDGSVETKWLSHGRHALEAALGARGGACVASYALTTGNDAPERDPVCWRLEGRLFPTGEWALLDERVGRPQPVPVARKADLLLALERPCERSHLEPPECPSAPTDGPLPEPAAPAAPAAPASSPSASTAAPEHDSQLGPESAHDGAVRGTSRPTHDTSTMPSAEKRKVPTCEKALPGREAARGAELGAESYNGDSSSIASSYSSSPSSPSAPSSPSDAGAPDVAERAPERTRDGAAGGVGCCEVGLAGAPGSVVRCSTRCSTSRERERERESSRASSSALRFASAAALRAAARLHSPPCR